MSKKLYMEKPASTHTPVMLRVGHGLLIQAINLARKAENLDPIPLVAEISTHVPSGGDWSNMDLVISRDQDLVIRWTVKNDSDDQG